MARTTMRLKTTTPIPSLKRLAPAILASKAGGTWMVFKIPMTATGSVGEIKAPKTSEGISFVPVT